MTPRARRLVVLAALAGLLLVALVLAPLLQR